MSTPERPAVTERRMVTVLFADIVDSSATAATRDPEKVRHAFAVVFDRARSLLAAHGGTVEKFIGDQVMAVFGVPRAHEDDAERAVRAAVALRDLSPELSVTLELPISFRIGVNTGEVATGVGLGQDFLVTGQAVNIGARLYPAAEPGGILVGPLTRSLTRTAITYGDERVVEGKGTGLTRAWPVLGVITEPGVPERGIAGLRAPLLGRDAELSALRDRFDRASADDRPHLVTVVAEAGVGKSRLLREFGDSVDAAVRVGRCLPYGQAVAHHALRTMIPLEALVMTGEPVSDRLRVLTGHAAAADVLPGVAAEDLEIELRWAFRRHVRDVATDRPTVLVFEDMHWATPRLLDLVEDLAENGEGKVLVCCLARPELLETRAGWGTRAARASVIRLRPLDPRTSERLIHELLSIAELPTGLVTDIVARSGGNPLFVEEILRALIDAGHLRRVDGGWESVSAPIADEVPNTLRSVITARLDLLTADTRALLQRGSVLGRHFSLSGIRALAPELGPMDEALRNALRSELLATLDEPAPTPGRIYQFRHALIRDAIYASIPKQERIALHELAAKWLAERVSAGEELDELVAHHFEAAFRLADELRDAGRARIGRAAYKTLVTAGERHRKDARTAAAFYDRAEHIAREIGTPDAERANDIAWRAVLTHLPKHADTDQSELFGELARVRGLGLTTGLAHLLSYASLHLTGAERTRMAEEAVSVARSIDDPEAIAWAMWYLGAGLPREEHVRWRHLLDDVLALAKAHQLHDVLALALFQAQAAHFFEGAFTRARELLEESDRHARASGSRAAIARVHSGFVGLYGTLRHSEAARPFVESAINYVAEVPNPEVYAHVHQAIAFGLQGIGAFEEARRVAERGLQVLGDRPAPSTRSVMNWSLARSNAMLGNLEQARQHLGEMRRVMPADAIEHHAWADWTTGVIEHAAGNRDVAVRALRTAVATAEGSVTAAYGVGSWGSFLAQMRESLADALAAEDGTQARALYLAARDFWSDPLASRRYEELETKLERLSGAGD